MITYNYLDKLLLYQTLSENKMDAWFCYPDNHRCNSIENPCTHMNWADFISVLSIIALN